MPLNQAEHKLKPDLNPASELLHAGMKLVKLTDMTKRPVGEGWNKSDNFAKTIDGSATGYGMPLAENGLCSIDPDNYALAKVGMKALGFDLDQLMSEGVRTLSTRPGSGGRSTFRAEGDIIWLKFGSRVMGTLIEFRASSPNLQDCVPGLLYQSAAGDVFSQRYANGKTFLDAPPLPDDLYNFWLECSEDLNKLHAAQDKFYKAVEAHLGKPIAGNRSISTGKSGASLAFSAPGLRQKFNAENKVEDILTRSGKYWLDPKTKRWTHEGSEGAPAIRPIPGKDDLWQSDHGSDPLCGTFDAWSAFVVLDHAGDCHSAKMAYAATVDVDHASRRESQRRESQEIGEGVEELDIPEIISVDEMNERLVFLADGSRVMDVTNPFHVLALNDFKNMTRASRTEVETSEFNSNGERKTKSKSNVDIWMESVTRKTAHSITFKAAGGAFEFDPEGRRCVNSWRGYRRPTETGDADASMFFDHVSWLFGERAGDFLDWLAHVEQKPGELPHTAWLHISSKTGTGRNWVSSVLARVFAGHVAPSIDLVRIMESGFNERLSRKTLAICDEIREGGGSQWKHAEKLKEIVTAEYRNINPKYGRMSVEYNACRFLLFSNHRSAIPLDDTDRRFEVVICDEQPKPEGYYTKLYGALSNPKFIAAVAKALAERDISGFKPGRHAEQSAAKRQVITASRSDEMCDLIEFTETYPHDLATAERLRQSYGQDSASFNHKAFNASVSEAGWVNVGRKVINGKKQTIYAKRDVSAEWTLSLNRFERHIPACDGGSA